LSEIFVNSILGVYVIGYKSKDKAHREPQRGPEKHSRGALLERKYLNFLMAHSCELYIFERRRGLQTSQGPR